MIIACGLLLLILIIWFAWGQAKFKCGDVWCNTKCTSYYIELSLYSSRNPCKFIALGTYLSCLWICRSGRPPNKENMKRWRFGSKNQHSASSALPCQPVHLPVHTWKWARTSQCMIQSKKQQLVPARARPCTTVRARAGPCRNRESALFGRQKARLWLSLSVHDRASPCTRPCTASRIA